MKGLLFIFLTLLFPFNISAQGYIKKGDVISINGIKALVFYVDDSGKHGKAISVKAYRGKKNIYCSKSSLLNDIPMNTVDDGMINTKSLYDYVVENSISLDEFPVYKWCASLGDGWYIPAIEELKEFINYWLGNEVEEADWDNDNIEETTGDISHKQKVNNILLEAGGIPFLNGVFTSTKSDKDKIYVYVYDRKKDFWKFVLLSPMKMDSYTVGRAFYKF